MVLDLCTEHDAEYQEFLSELRRWLGMAHQPPELATPKPARKGNPNGHGGDADNVALRAWARAQGHNVGSKGRIRSELRKEWLAAGRPDASPVRLVREVDHPSQMRGPVSSVD